MAIVQSPPGPPPSMLNRLESDFDGGGSGRGGEGGWGAKRNQGNPVIMAASQTPHQSNYLRGAGAK